MLGFNNFKFLNMFIHFFNIYWKFEKYLVFTAKNNCPYLSCPVYCVVLFKRNNLDVILGPYFG